MDKQDHAYNVNRCKMVALFEYLALSSAFFGEHSTPECF